MKEKKKKTGVLRLLWLGLTVGALSAAAFVLDRLVLRKKRGARGE